MCGVDVKLPQLIDYQQAVYGRTFADPLLRNGQPRLNPQRQPSVASGGFALTFDVAAGGRRFAVRCFHKQSQRLRERYIAVGDFVRQHRGSLDFLTDVAYVAEGIRVNGTVFPIVRMPWVDGERLDTWVENHLHEPHRLDGIRNQITAAATRLRAVGAAHGDLQHGNILVDNADRVRLVDYDGMFLPTLASFGASEYGHRNYQHPERGDSYDKRLDTFAASVIDVSLAALTHDPSLWWDFNTGENLILEAEDFAAPAQSEVLARLAGIAPLSDRTRRLVDACRASFVAMPAILAGERTSKPNLQSPTASRRPAGPRALAAHDRATLMARVGDQVTIVGRVTSTRMAVGQVTTATFINFGDYRDGDFTIVAFGALSQELEAAFGKNVEALRGSWVTLSGMVTQYQSRWSGVPTPQIELERVQTLRVLSETEAKAQLAPPQQYKAPSAPQAAPAPTPQSSTPASGVYRWKAPPSSKPNPKADDLVRRLDQLYSSPSFHRPSPLPPPAPPPPRRTPPPPAPPPAYPSPPAQPPAQPRSAPARTSWWQRQRDKWRR
jgi:hypothetical protein